MGKPMVKTIHQPLMPLLGSAEYAWKYVAKLNKRISDEYEGSYQLTNISFGGLQYTGEIGDMVTIGDVVLIGWSENFGQYTFELTAPTQRNKEEVE